MRMSPREWRAHMGTGEYAFYSISSEGVIGSNNWSDGESHWDLESLVRGDHDERLTSELGTDELLEMKQAAREELTHRGDGPSRGRDDTSLPLSS